MITSSQKRWFFALLVLVVAIGTTSGIVASVTLNQSLNTYAESLLAGRRLGTSSIAPRTTVTPYEDAVRNVSAITDASVVTIMRSSLDSRQSTSWFNEHQALGYGVVVSADGWILVRAETFANITNTSRDIDVWIGGTRYGVTQYVADTLTDFALIKIEARGLAPVAFAASEEVTAGAQVFAAATREALFATTVQDIRVPTGVAVLRAEAFSYGWEFAQSLPVVVPVFTADAQLVALSGESGALPVHYGTAFIKEIIRNNAPAHAGLGAYVVDVAGIVNIDPTLRQGQERGALVVAPASGAAAVVRDSPAAAAGLVAGDIVTAVDGVRVDHRHTLAEILRLYDPGESASLTVVRNKEEQSITVTFANYEDLLY